LNGNVNLNGIADEVVVLFSVATAVVVFVPSPLGEEEGDVVVKGDINLLLLLFIEVDCLKDLKSIGFIEGIEAPMLSRTLILSFLEVNSNSAPISRTKKSTTPRSLNFSNTAATPIFHCCLGFSAWKTKKCLNVNNEKKYIF
tara:strand:- start:676 stop:1101 length:426 start_codon:yes stop_codon:yes gene_type:complete